MIAEYALEPEMVANWCTDRYKCQFFKNSFGSAQGRLVSRYPRKWAKKVWDACVGSSEMDKKRLEEILLRLQETLIKRKDFFWDDAATWVDNAVKEHARHPFSVILARNNTGNRSEILEEDAVASTPCRGWDNPHGIMVNRNAPEMASAVHQMLSCCRWVKLIDPYFVQAKPGHKKSLSAFLNILAAKRPVGPAETIEMHTSGAGATTDHLKEFYEKIIPVGLQVTLYRWQQRPGGQNLHNRYILTDLGGVSFQHGLDAGRKGETDDITRLDLDQHVFHCKQYDPASQTFDQAADPLLIIGK